MAHREPSVFAVRARKWLLVTAAAATLCAPSIGCFNTRRASMRPVFGGPGRAIVVPATPATVAPCPAGTPCEGGAITAEPTSAVIRPGFSEPGAVISTPSSVGRSSAVSPPVAPAPADIQVRPSNSKAAPSSEPAYLEELDANDGGSSFKTPQLPSSARRSKPTTGRTPSASNTNGSRSATAERVAALADDPGDLVQPPKVDRAWKYIVLHHSAHPTGGYAQIDRDHKQLKNFQGCGYHFVIGNGTESPDGLIEVAKRWSDQKAGAHCRDGHDPAMNDYGIGICLVGDLDNASPTPKQLESTRALIAYLKTRYRIADDKIGTHAQVATGPTDCPGRRFPTEALIGRVDTSVH